MQKSERLFEILRFIIKHHYSTVIELSQHFSVSERNTYRDLNTLIKSGFIVRSTEQGYKCYKMADKWAGLFNAFDSKALEALRKIIFLGISNTNDAELIQYGRDLIYKIDKMLLMNK